MLTMFFGSYITADTRSCFIALQLALFLPEVCIAGNEELKSGIDWYCNIYTVFIATTAGGLYWK